MKTPPLTRVKITKFMLSRIDEPLTLDDIIIGSYTSFVNTIKQLEKMTREKMITKTKYGYKMTFRNAKFIIDNMTELALICEFEKIIKSKLKRHATQV